MAEFEFPIPVDRVKELVIQLDEKGKLTVRVVGDSPMIKNAGADTTATLTLMPAGKPPAGDKDEPGITFSDVPTGNFEGHDAGFADAPSDGHGDFEMPRISDDFER